MQHWRGQIGFVAALAVAYFLAARLGLALLVGPENVDVFWPASGIAAGILIALGPGLRVPVAASVMAATVAANLLGDRNVWSSLAFALCNAGEALLTAWLIGRRFGPAFKLDDLRRVLGFLAAAAIGAGVAAGGAAVAMRLFHDPTVPLLNVWRVWFASDAIGIVTVAPLLIGLAAAVRERPPSPELIEGTMALVGLAVVSGFALALPPGPWARIVPAALLFPLVLWLAARCRPLFAAAAAFIIAVAVVRTIAYGIGRFGDPSLPFADRVLAAQIGMMAATLCALVLAALFAERRQNEAALQERERKLRELFDAALDAVIAMTPDGRIVAWSKQAETTFGWRRDEALGQRLVSLIIPRDQREAHRKGLERFLLTGAGPVINRRVEVRALHKDGREFPAELAIVPLKRGDDLTFYGFVRDITERKTAEVALKESEARYRALYEDNPSMYFTVDVAGTVLSVNQFGAEQLGCTTAQLVGQSVLQVIHREDQDLAREQLALCVQNPTRVAEIELRKVRRDGSILWVREVARALQNPEGQTVFLIVCEDITERKRAEAALKASEARLQEALTAGHVMAFEWDPATRLSQHSENTAQILGFEPQQNAADPRMSFLARVHPDDRDRFKAHVYGVRPERPSYEVSFRFIRPDGREVWLEEMALAEFDASGRFLLLKGLTRDITYRKRLEERQNLLIAELDHRVKNVLASVAVVARYTREGSNSMDELVEALDGRIQSMADAQALLSRNCWQGVSLTDLLRHELAPYATADNTTVEGADVALTAEATQAVAMVVHELVTNAAKYGALSTPQGRVSVRWAQRSNGNSRGRLMFEWNETRGPPVTAPTQAGYGSSVIRDLIPYELGGAVELAFAADGVRCRIEIPLKWISDERPTAPPKGASPIATPGAGSPAAPPR